MILFLVCTVCVCVCVCASACVCQDMKEREESALTVALQTDAGIRIREIYITYYYVDFFPLSLNLTYLLFLSFLLLHFSLSALSSFCAT